MAERRMISIGLVDDDRFLDMSQGAQLLYFHLSLRADDDGFVTPKKVMRLVGSSQKDLDALIHEGFLLSFDSGVVVIAHWRVNNTIRKDRYTPTVYQKELSELTVNNGVYERCTWQPVVTEDSGTEEEHGNQMATNGKPDDNQPETDGSRCDNHNGNQTTTSMATSGKPDDNQWLPQVRLGKGKKELSLSKESSSKKESSHTVPDGCQEFIRPSLNEVIAYFQGNLLSGDPEGFYDHYEAVGWMIGSTPVVDWKAAARKWAVNERKFGYGRSSPKGEAASLQTRPRDYDGSYDGHQMKEVSI